MKLGLVTREIDAQKKPNCKPTPGKTISAFFDYHTRTIDYLVQHEDGIEIPYLDENKPDI